MWPTIREQVRNGWETDDRRHVLDFVVSLVLPSARW
jgi:hypothetical protein